MNVLVNTDEWLVPWIRDSAIEQVKQVIKIDWSQARQYIKECRREFKKSGLITIDFNRVNYLLEKDLLNFRDVINKTFKTKFKDCKLTTLENIQKLNITDQQLIDTYLNDASRSFAKLIAPQLSNDLHWILDDSRADWSQPFFIRNIINNESLLSRCLDERLNFWFVDTGYTNFLHEKQKVWHRLVKNHIHHGEVKHYYPDDRLHLFPTMPKRWRKKGSTILVIESSPAHYAMKGTSLETWRQNITEGIRAVSDRPVEFRPKNVDRKSRQSVYELLKETKEYYCVISDSSAAAVESIWAGTPVITLDKHITNSVSRQRLDQLNNLFKGDIEHWLAMLSYSQFTFDELCDGTAVSITKEYSDV